MVALRSVTRLRRRQTPVGPELTGDEGIACNSHRRIGSGEPRLALDIGQEFRGVIRPDDEILVKDAKLSAHAGIIFDHDRASALRTVHAYLDELEIRYCGRFGDWDYLWTDDSFISGERAAQRALDGG